MPKPSTQKKLLSVAIVLAVAGPAAAHAAHVRADEIRRENELARMTAMLMPLSNVNAGPRIVSLNGSVVGFQTATVARPIDDVMKGVADECASGKTDVALAGVVKTTADDPTGHDIELAHIETQAGPDGVVRASLCTFAPERRGSGEGVTGGKGDLPRVRYTLAQRIDAGTTRVVSLVNASSTPLEAMFPAEGDAPGSDLEGVARPERSKRTLTALVGSGEHEVRMYESTLPLAESMKSYDRAMRTLGWDETATLPEARMYRKDGSSMIASFLATETGTTVSIAPFEPREGTPPPARRPD